jgi:hypothetical protein
VWECCTNTGLGWYWLLAWDVAGWGWCADRMTLSCDAVELALKPGHLILSVFRNSIVYP